MAVKIVIPGIKPFMTRKAAFLDGYALGFVEGHRDAAQWTKQRIIDDLNHDAVISMTLDTDALERIVRIVEES
jgi:hypothetical protein